MNNNVNLLNSIKKIVNKVKNTSLDTALSLSNIIIRRDKKKLEKMHAVTNSWLKKCCNQKNIHFILNDNIKEEHLGIKKLHLNRNGNSIFAKNLLKFIEGNLFLNPLRDTYSKNDCYFFRWLLRWLLLFQILKKPLRTLVLVILINFIWTFKY